MNERDELVEAPDDAYESPAVEDLDTGEGDPVATAAGITLIG
jgi:hypothetical protein